MPVKNNPAYKLVTTKKRLNDHGHLLFKGGTGIKQNKNTA
jgi:hypothetical protein